MQRAKDFKVPVFLCFIDLCKAYDSVNRNLLWAMLRRVYNFSEKFVSIIEALHKETYGVVRFEGQLSEEYKVESGVKQGDVLAPTLFNLFLDVIIRTAMMKHPDAGVHIQYNLDAPLVNNSRHKFNMSDKVQILMYADDVVLLSNDRSVLNSLIQSLSEEFTRYGLKINTQKSKIMAVRLEADNTDTHLDNRSVHQIDGGFEEVEQYQYLGSILRNDCSIDEDIDTRIGKASIAFRSIRRLIWYQKKLKRKTKMRLFKSIIMPILLYGRETRAPLSNHVQRLQSFVNKCVRSICEISMRDMLRNTEIRRKGNIERVDSILQLKRLKWLGHNERMADSRWPKKLLVSKICGGKRSQGGQKHRWHDVVNNDLKAIGLVSGWRSKAKNRIEWQKSWLCKPRQTETLPTSNNNNLMPTLW